MSGTDSFPDSLMTILNQFVLLFYSTPGLPSMAPNKSHAIDIHAETKDDKAKHDDKEGFGMLVGKALHLGGTLVQPAPPCKPSACVNILLILLLVQRIVLVGHLLAHKEFLPTSHGCK